MPAQPCRAGVSLMRAFLLMLASVLAAGSAAAETIGAGASGQCYDTAGNGGADEARVGLDTDDPAGATVILPSGTGTAAALVEFLEGVPTQTACPNPRTFDYAEVDARAGDTYQQVCYGQGTLRTDGSCPQSPSGL